MLVWPFLGKYWGGGSVKKVGEYVHAETEVAGYGYAVLADHSDAGAAIYGEG